MESVEYDLDISGGLMPQIQELIAPPSLGDEPATTDKQDRRYRRPGRTINHDNCDSCKEGGDLICCDRCPAAFHLQCHDPPLTEDDLPSGEWLCHQCKHAPKTEEKANSLGDGQQQKSQQDVKVEAGTSSDQELKSDEKVANTSPMEVVTSKERPTNKSAFQTLIDLASCSNPSQFELPNDIACTTPIPGCGKRSKNKEVNRCGKKIAHELDNGLVPLPARLCFLCRMSCHIAPLVQCDYCPLLFHSDCVEPPLTALPNGKWMCPNHAEHVVDEKLMDKPSLAERVKLWDKYSGSVNSGAVQLRFINKSNKIAPMFRCKRKIRSRLKAKIPDSIVEHYKHPSRLLCRRGCLPHTSCNTSSVLSSAVTYSFEEEEQWLTSIVSFQSEVARYLATKCAVSSRSCVSEDTKTVVSPPVDSVAVGKTPCNEHQSYRNSTGHNQNGPVLGVNSSGVDVKTVEQNITLKTECESETSSKSGRTSGVSLCFPSASAQLKSMVLPNKGLVSHKPNNAAFATRVIRTSMSNCSIVSSPLKHLQTHVVNSQSMCHARMVNCTNASADAIKSISSSNTENPCIMQDKVSSTSYTKYDSIPSPSSSPFSLSFGSALQNAVKGMEDIEMDKLDKKWIQALAYQRLQQLYPDKCSIRSSPKLNSFLSQGTTDIRARALVLPYMGKGPTVPMCYRTLNIGVGADMDVCLANYGYCSYVSSKHACIFFDEVTKHYELLNYSEYGTFVDSVFYSCDLSQKPKVSPPPNSLSHAVRKLAKSTPRLADFPPPPLDSTQPMMSSRIRENQRSCDCKINNSCESSASNVGWEGTAVVHHGSFIKCGCLQFIFSITDYGSHPSILDDAKSDELTCTASSNTSTASSSSNTSLLGD